MSQPATAPLSALLRKEADLWILQCLDYDIAVQGPNLPDLCKDFERVLNGHIVIDMKAGIRPLSGIPRAPDMYWEAFRSGMKTESFRLHLVAPVSGRRARAPKQKQRTTKKKARILALPVQATMPWAIRSFVPEMRVA